MQCFSCKTSAAKLPVCNACGRATYCSRECQVQHWGQKHGHKFSCATKNAAGELVVHRDSLLGRVAAKNPQLFGATRKCEARKIAVSHSAAALTLLTAVQEAEMPEDDAKRAAADPPLPEDGSRKRREESDRVMHKRPAAGPAVRKETEASMDSLPLEMLEAILRETDIETAVKLAQTSHTFASLFRSIRDSPRILDMIVGNKDPLEDPKATWKAELLRRAIKTQVADLVEVTDTAYENLEDPVEMQERVNGIVSAVRPMTFYALVLSLGRPKDFNHTRYRTYSVELDDFWLDKNDTPLLINMDDAAVLEVLCHNPMVTRVKDINVLLRHVLRCEVTTSLVRAVITTLSAYPEKFSVDYEMFHQIYNQTTRRYLEPRHDILKYMFRVSKTLTAADWANLFYYSYINDILWNEPIVTYINGYNPYKGFGGSVQSRPIRDFTEEHRKLPYIPDKVADSLRDIFKDPTVSQVYKQDGWRNIERTGKNGENWLEMWSDIVTKLKQYRKSDDGKSAKPTPMDAAAV